MATVKRPTPNLRSANGSPRTKADALTVYLSTFATCGHRPHGPFDAQPPPGQRSRGPQLAFTQLFLSAKVTKHMAEHPSQWTRAHAAPPPPEYMPGYICCVRAAEAEWPQHAAWWPQAAEAARVEAGRKPQLHIGPLVRPHMVTPGPHRFWTSMPGTQISMLAALAVADVCLGGWARAWAKRRGLSWPGVFHSARRLGGRQVHSQ